MDLGIARLNGGNKYSAYGFIGTPEYSAPEQILRDTNNTEIKAQTDIYALGVTFYELLTGINPFKTDVEADMLSRQIKVNLPYNKKIPKALFNVIKRATEKVPNKRYRSATEFKFAIMEALSRRNENLYLIWIQDNSKSLVLGTLFILSILLIILLII